VAQAIDSLLCKCEALQTPDPSKIEKRKIGIIRNTFSVLRGHIV
jgi:hypothetical protein